MPDFAAAPGPAADGVPAPTPALRSVLGPVVADAVGTVLAAEFLLRSPRPTPGNAGVPATDAEFARRRVDMSMLGRLMMGAANLDDRTLGVADAEGALRAFAHACREMSGSGPGSSAAVVALAPAHDSGESGQDPASLAELSRTTGVLVVRGTNGGDALRAAADASAGARAEAVRAAILADLGAHPARTGSTTRERAGARPEVAAGRAFGRAGVVGLVSADDPDVLVAAAEAAREAGVALVLAPAAGLAELERALDRVARTGLDRSRVIVTGASDLIVGGVRAGGRSSEAPGASAMPAGPRTADAGTQRAGVAPGTGIAPRIGVDASTLDALLDLGAQVCFDDLGRIPSVRTVVSDHDVALAILRCADRGAGGRILLSSGIREKHRLTAFGGNGLEFVPQQFLPYLGMCGADDALVRAVGGGNAARVLAVAPDAAPSAAAPSAAAPPDAAATPHRRTTRAGGTR